MAAMLGGRPCDDDGLAPHPLRMMSRSVPTKSL
jgi:hypothetical protein